MKKLLYTASILIAIAFIGLSFNFNNSKEGEINIGDAAPGLGLPLTNFEGKNQALKDFKGENGLLVVFTCNTCPFVVAWEDRYNELYAEAKKHGINMILVNSNEAKRNNDDSMEKMKAHAKEQNYLAPYLIDGKHQIADAFGARTTPHVFMFDKNFKLQYKGAIDDNYENKNEVSATYLSDAIKKMAAGQAVEPATTKAIGCSIKRLKS